MKQRVLLASLVAALALNSLIKSPDRSGPRGPAQEHAARAPEQPGQTTETSSQSPPNAGDPNMQ